MIVKVTRGADMAGAIRYLAANKAELERVNPHVVAGLDREGDVLTPAAVQDIARELDASRVLSGTDVPDGHVWHASLTLDASEGALTDTQWNQVAEGFMGRMNFGPVRWVGVHHGPNAGGGDHVHIVATMVRDDGGRAEEWQSLRRASRAVAELEREHGLRVIESRELGVGARGAVRPALERAAMLGREPESHYLERVVRACAVEARDERDYVRLVRAHGVTVRPRMAKGSTEVVGLSYSVNGSASYGGGRLARDLTLPRLRERWSSPVAETADQAAHDVAGKLAAWSIRSERTPGPIARESRELGRYAQTRAASGGLVLTAAMAAVLRERIRVANREAELRQELDDERARRQQGPRAERDHGIGL